MSIFAGKDVLVTVSADDATYNTLTETNEIEQNFTTNNEDVSVFGDDWIDRAQQLKDATYSASGFYDTGDTTGQQRVLSAYINNTALYIKVLFDGTNGYKQQVVVESFNVSASVDGNVTYSAELAAKAAPTAVP